MGIKLAHEKQLLLNAKIIACFVGRWNKNPQNATFTKNAPISHVSTPTANRIVSIIGLVVLAKIMLSLLASNDCSNVAKIANPTLRMTQPNVAQFRPPRISNMIPLTKKMKVTNMEREFIVLAIKSHWAGQHDDDDVSAPS
mmetsp:Transcript_7004/g.11683  ORF Transcript_7004/g.11683 Transcript_7004/m.11683 type:complete len:141 (-) Transcript_7004:400-822(-)